MNFPAVGNGLPVTLRWMTQAPNPSQSMLALLLTVGLALGFSLPSIAETGPADREDTAVILAVNDVYRVEGVDGGRRGGLARLRTLRAELERKYPGLILLHAGDFLFPSFTSKVFFPEDPRRRFQRQSQEKCPGLREDRNTISGRHMVDIMNYLDGDNQRFDERMVVTFGNHEFEVESADALSCLMDMSQFRWLGSNLKYSAEVSSARLHDRVILNSGRLKVGIFSLTLNSLAPDYIGFAWRASVAGRITGELRAMERVDLVIALTHQTVQEDEALLRELCKDKDKEKKRCPDLIIGGHEHERTVKETNGRFILKADSDARTATLVRVTPAISKQGEPHKAPAVTYQFINLGPVLPLPDADVQARVAMWLQLEDKLYCENLKPPKEEECLRQPAGRTQVELVGEEGQIRKYETNLGNWIADQSLSAFKKQGAQVAFINSGSLRLNENVPAGEISERQLQQLFYYETDLKTGLRLIRIDGQTLQRVASHAVSDWTGNGHWLQISGFAFRHDPDNGTAEALTLLQDGHSRSIKANETLLAVTNDYLANGGDGYTFLSSLPIMSDKADNEKTDFRDLVRDALRANPIGIAPHLEGRICNELRGGPCVAVSATAPNLGAGWGQIDKTTLLFLAALGSVLTALVAGLSLYILAARQFPQDLQIEYGTRGKKMTMIERGNLIAAYQALCDSYHAIDDFQAKLLGFLPLATGTGIFVLFSNLTDNTQRFLAPIGAFGFVITLGLFAYELYGIKKCHALIEAGQRMEKSLQIEGHFITRPREVAGVINEPFAAGIIYSAVLAAWVYLALIFTVPRAAAIAGSLVFAIGFAGSVLYNLQLRRCRKEVPVRRK